MVTTRGMATGTQPKAQPLPAKLSNAEKATKAARLKAEREEKKAEKAAVKALNDAKKAAAKAEKDAIKAAAKVAKAANAKSTTKGTKRTAAKTKGTKITNIGKTAKTAKTAKTTKKAKTTKASINHDEDEDEDDEDEESEEEHYEPQAKRRRVETRAPPNLRVEIGPPKAERPALQIGQWVYIKEAFLPEGIENGDNRPLPQIWIGGAAPQPRWVITQTQNVKRPTSNAKSSRPDGTRDLGNLQWTFEEGDFEKWAGLEYPALYELAHKCLEYTLIDKVAQEQIYGSLAHPGGPLHNAVAAGDRWHPALPPVPMTRHFSSGPERTIRKSSDTAFYFRNYERPNMTVQVDEKRIQKAYPHAVNTHIYNQATSEEWPTAPRSASPDAESERGSEQGGEGNQSVDSRRSSVTRNSSLELNPEGTYSEPTTPVPLGNEEKISRIFSEDGSIFGDADDVQVEPNSARDSREQSPNSLFSGSGSGSDNEVSASSKTSETSKVNVADDNSAQSTNSLSPVSHDGLFSPGQIERYYSKKKMNFERLGGIEHHEAPERKRQAQSSSNSEREALEALENVQKEAETSELETEEVMKPSKRMRMESTSTSSSSPPATRKTAAEIKVDKIMSFARAGQEKRDEMRAAAAEKISDRPPVALLKKTTGNQTGARSQADAPSPEIPPNLQDGFLEQTKAYLKNPIQRARHFPDPLAVRRVRVWAGEELASHKIKPTVNATLPPWAERHRPFSQWQDPIGLAPVPAARTKVSRSKKRSKGQCKRRPRPASVKELSVSSARWSSFR
ncbi:unnamed protein product [Penicillium nalgiovense]|uniref:Uncharacterized protein n=1 Tax=Penicillium nalgiovense TaxID=60175 RepID=A0A9W4MRY6_PENNA|nr:unnamed protein product [Penicillium nalgiovense]CAG7989848.1 unnamed protein product [Penicillium nalgiovense]CAG7991594.1 unnamed protein product [Penicillium nalgiovense]CAG7992692.1 unnamed protein product [Penicillium nalgiovense]CAG7997183.1 unnamed protein product [Penicillium nalgiovense]